MTNVLREPLPVKPFLRWCDRREAQIRRELDEYPAISGSRDGGVTARPPHAADPHPRLIMDLGWDPDNGQRRLYRWRHELTSPYVERAAVEEALWHAGADIADVYGDLQEADAGRDAYCTHCHTEVTVTDSVCPWCEKPCINSRPPGGRPRVGQGRKLTDAQVRAAHVIYEQHGLSLRQVGQLLYEPYGYTSADNCAVALRRAFAGLGLPRRDVREANHAAHYKHGLAVRGERAPLYKRQLRLARHGPCQTPLKDGTPCPRAAQPGTSTCGYHSPDELARRRQQIDQVNATQRNLLRWADRSSAA